MSRPRSRRAASRRAKADAVEPHQKEQVQSTSDDDEDSRGQVMLSNSKAPAVAQTTRRSARTKRPRSIAPDQPAITSYLPKKAKNNVPDETKDAEETTQISNSKERSNESRTGGARRSKRRLASKVGASGSDVSEDENDSSSSEKKRAKANPDRATMPTSLPGSPSDSTQEDNKTSSDEELIDEGENGESVTMERKTNPSMATEDAENRESFSPVSPSRYKTGEEGGNKQDGEKKELSRTPGGLDEDGETEKCSDGSEKAVQEGSTDGIIIREAPKAEKVSGCEEKNSVESEEVLKAARQPEDARDNRSSSPPNESAAITNDNGDVAETTSDSLAINGSTSEVAGTMEQKKEESHDGETRVNQSNSTYASDDGNRNRQSPCPPDVGESSVADVKTKSTEPLHSALSNTSTSGQQRSLSVEGEVLDLTKETLEETSPRNEPAGLEAKVEKLFVTQSSSECVGESMRESSAEGKKSRKYSDNFADSIISSNDSRNRDNVDGESSQKVVSENKSLGEKRASPDSAGELKSSNDEVHEHEPILDDMDEMEDRQNVGMNNNSRKATNEQTNQTIAMESQTAEISMEKTLTIPRIVSKPEGTNSEIADEAKMLDSSSTNKQLEYGECGTAPVAKAVNTETCDEKADGATSGVKRKRLSVKLGIDEVVTRPPRAQENSRSYPAQEERMSCPAEKVLQSDQPMNPTDEGESHVLQNVATVQRPLHAEVTPSFSPELIERQSRLPCIARLKQQLFVAGSHVHQGLGAESRFAGYWNVLCQNIEKGNISNKGRSRDFRDPIASFLRTKKLRKLHNRLILGIIECCRQEQTADQSVQEQIPRFLCDRTLTCRHEMKLLPQSVVASEFALLSERSPQTEGAWLTSAFGVGLVSPRAGKGEESFPASLPMAPSSNHLLGTIVGESNSATRRSDATSCLPGALSVESQIMRISSMHGMTVSSNVVWALVIAVKQYLSSIVKQTISGGEALALNQVISPISSPHLIVQSTKSTPKRSNGRKVTTKETVVTGPPLIDFKTRNDRHCVSSIDISLGLTKIPPPVGPSLGGATSRCAVESCLASSFKPHPGQTLNLEKVNSYVLARIEESALKGLTHKVHPTALSSARTDDAVSDSLATPQTIPQPSGPKRTSSGMGRGAKDLAALRARAMEKPSPSSSSPHSLNNRKNVALDRQPATAIRSNVEIQNRSAFGKINPNAQGKHEGAEGSFTGTPEKSSPMTPGDLKAGSPPDPSAKSEAVDSLNLENGQKKNVESPAGRGGRGSGVKDLAAIRARSMSSTERVHDARPSNVLEGAKEEINVPRKEILDSSVVIGIEGKGAKLIESKETVGLKAEKPHHGAIAESVKTASTPVEIQAAVKLKDGNGVLVSPGEVSGRERVG